MQLDILRHAKSSWADPGQDDHDRPLNRRGERAAGAIGRHLAIRGDLPDRVLCSSARRARETWERVARRLPASHELDLVVVKGLYLAGPADLIEELRALPEAVERALLVGHNPGVAQLAQALSGEGSNPDPLRALRAKYPTAALATLEFTGPWCELGARCGRLVRFLTPKDLA